MLIFLVFLICFILINYEVGKRNIYIWFPVYIYQYFKRKPKINFNESVHIVFSFVDHFEPRWNEASYEDEVKRVDIWLRRYPELAKKHKDANGVCPQHTFFYPAEEYRAEHLEKLARLCREGFGEVEIQLHHNNDTSGGFREKIEQCKEDFKGHNLLSINKESKEIRFGFVHGNWALDNSRRDGKRCGVNNELKILRETGCYADFTLPSAPSDTQTRKINSIYYAKDNPDKPKSHNTGIDVEIGKKPSGDLMIIQGPLALNWKRRKWRILPRIENGSITRENPPIPQRVDLWIRRHIHVKGKPNWIFVKVYTHGAQEKNFDTLLGKPMDEMLTYLETKYNDGKNFRLHYVTAREMYNIIKAAEAGKVGEPGKYRNYLLEANIKTESQELIGNRS